MTGDDLRNWMNRMRLRSVSKASLLLGIKRQTLTNYLTGAQPVPRLVELATLALSAGLDQMETSQ